jgi:ribosomal protein S18 acetylase RimI-like enzyme
LSLVFTTLPTEDFAYDQQSGGGPILTNMKPKALDITLIGIIFPVHFGKIGMSLTIRSIVQADAEACGKIGYQAHKIISSAHGYPSEQPSIEFAVGMIKTLLVNPSSRGTLAECNGRILGSIFLHVFPPSPVAAIGPLTVDPSAEGGVGRALMNSVLGEARKRQYDCVRLVQSPSHVRSFVLYTKCGFTLREPLFLMQGNPIRGSSLSRPAHDVRAAQVDDIPACNQLCMSVHGFSREMELRQAIEQDIASLSMDNQGNIAGYAAGIGFFSHAVAKTNEDLKALVSSAPAIIGHGLFVPARNADLMRWLLEAGFRISWPANLMTIGQYNEPSAPYLPSIAY